MSTLFFQSFKCAIHDTEQWTDIPSGVKEHALALGYTKCTWNNHPFGNPLEHSSWSCLTSKEKKHANSLNCNEHSWDKYVNHFVDYAWDELMHDEIYCWEYLGYSKSSWESNGKQPASSKFFFDELSVLEQSGAECAGYTKKNNPIELTSWNILSNQQRKYATIFKCNEASWDKNVNHYFDYSWEELLLYDIGCWCDLGYSKLSWEGEIDPPVSEHKYFSELSSRELKGAKCAGYSAKTWDNDFVCMKETIPSPSSQPTTQPSTSEPTLTQNTGTPTFEITFNRDK